MLSGFCDIQAVSIVDVKREELPTYSFLKQDDRIIKFGIYKSQKLSIWHLINAAKETLIFENVDFSLKGTKKIMSSLMGGEMKIAIKKCIHSWHTESVANNYNVDIYTMNYASGGNNCTIYGNENITVRYDNNYRLPSDVLQKLVNNVPDANMWTIRIIITHLWKRYQNSDIS